MRNNLDEYRDKRPATFVHKCEICKRDFLKQSQEWAYVSTTKAGVKAFCSWHCLREYERQKQEQKKRGKKQDGTT